MSLFFRKRKPLTRTEQMLKNDKDAAAAVRHSASIEIQAAKDASDEAYQKARRANKQLNKLLVDNGFTIAIFIAAGGTVRPAKSQRKKATQ